MYAISKPLGLKQSQTIWQAFKINKQVSQNTYTHIQVCLSMHTHTYTQNLCVESIQSSNMKNIVNGNLVPFNASL